MIMNVIWRKQHKRVYLRMQEGEGCVLDALPFALICIMYLNFKCLVFLYHFFQHLHSVKEYMPTIYLNTKVNAYPNASKHFKIKHIYHVFFF